MTNRLCRSHTDQMIAGVCGGLTTLAPFREPLAIAADRGRRGAALAA
jgi:fluoride ion exporter CrcB/FEX